MSNPLQWPIHGRLYGLDTAGKPVGAGIATTATIVAVASTANVSLVTFTLKDFEGNTVAEVRMLDIWLSDAATGAGLTATTASGAVAAAAASGADIGTLTTKKALRVQTLATGLYTLSITDTAKTGFFPCAQLASGTVVGAQMVTASYG